MFCVIKIKLKQLTEIEAEELLILVQDLPIRHMPHQPLLKGAFEIARDYKLTVYDAIFLELAKQKATHIFTADKALASCSEVLLD